jgi:6-phosphogluconolactonase
MTVESFISHDPAAAAKNCAEHVVSVLDEALSNQRFATFAVSGGTTPRLMFQRLAQTKLRWEGVHLFWVDERCVPPSDAASNYRMVEESLIRPLRLSARQVHRIQGEMAPPAAAMRYVSEIRNFLGLGMDDLPSFDLVHRGMGGDAHTASLFPGDPAIDDHQGIAAAVYAPQFRQWRVTLLPGVLEAAKHTVAGADKSEALRAVFHEPIDPKKYPAQIGTRTGHDMAWFVDEAAATLLRGAGA